MCVCVCVWYNPRGDPPPSSSLCLTPVCRLCECTEAEAEIVLQLKNELREKELKLTDIRLEALSSAHHLDQIREAMNRMQVRSHTRRKKYFQLCFRQAKLNSLQFIQAKVVCSSLKALEHDSYQLGS